MKVTITVERNLSDKAVYEGAIGWQVLDGGVLKVLVSENITVCFRKWIAVTVVSQEEGV